MPSLIAWAICRIASLAKRSNVRIEADRVYDVLVREAGAHEEGREQFVVAFPRMPQIREYRFMGALGFGGKYWAPTKKRPHGWVNYYVEDSTAERDEMMDRANQALAALDTSE